MVREDIQGYVRREEEWGKPRIRGRFWRGKETSWRIIPVWFIIFKEIAINDIKAINDITAINDVKVINDITAINDIKNSFKQL